MTRSAEEIAAEARGSFDLFSHLDNAEPVRDSITVYTNEVAGKELGGTEPKFKLIRGIEVPDGERRWGVLGDLADLREEASAAADVDKRAELNVEIAELGAKAEELREQIKASGITFHLQALPELVLEDAQNQARAAFEIEPGADIPDDKAKDHAKRLSAEITSRIVIGITNAEGAAAPLLTAATAALLPTKLPASEYRRLARKITELQYETKIAEGVVDSADF